MKNIIYSLLILFILRHSSMAKVIEVHCDVYLPNGVVFEHEITELDGGAKLRLVNQCRLKFDTENPYANASCEIIYDRDLQGESQLKIANQGAGQISFSSQYRDTRDGAAAKWSDRFVHAFSVSVTRKVPRMVSDYGHYAACTQRAFF